jgi:von Willebrand factor type A domain
MAVKRRSASTFSLSFLDIMSCGLGATVLLFLILKHNTESVPANDENLRSEVNMLQEEILIGTENLARIRNTISNVDDEFAVARGLARQIQDEIDKLRGQIALLDPNAEDTLDDMRARLALLEQQKKLLEDEITGGNRVRQFLGEGQRQYLTGLRLGGENILILVDTSDSMLDETIVNIIRRRVRGDAVKRDSPKWKQTQRIVEWIVSNIPYGSHFQIVPFNAKAAPLVPTTKGNWLATDINADVEMAIAELNKLVPSGGTNLYNAFATIDSFSPRPDNIFLITDGLPTQGAQASNSSTISGNDRLRLFNEASRLVNKRSIPFNIMLMPMEGDPLAAAAFWRLSLDTKGSFIAPSSDWP